MITIPNNRLSGYNIIAQMPVFRSNGTQDDDAHVILGHDPSRKYPKYVTALVNTRSIEFGEWFWGHYFEGSADSLKKAIEDFVLRSRVHMLRPEEVTT